MSNLKKKVEESSEFYKKSFLDFDLQLTHFNYKTFKPYFKGDLALELGPAKGYMTQYLINDFNNLELLEGSEELLNCIPNYDNVTKYHSLFEDFKTKNKYDTIIMAHVLEHIYDPVTVCSKIYNWLDNEGVFLVSVPNAKSIHRMAAKEMGILKNEYELNSRDHELGHYRVYDMDLLKEHLTKAGFTIIESGGIFLKPLSNKQIQDTWTQEMIEGFYKMGSHFPENCAEIFVVCTK
ncbi:MAG: methyltransferase domain-containing protein [Flavobacteriaceae bacterium]